MEKRKICITQDSDQLIWVQRRGGNFNLPEARAYLENREGEEPLPWAVKIRKTIFWKKIKSFLWIMMQGHIITWDNIIKCGFIGPSRFLMCHKNAETKNHLLNACEEVPEVWDWGNVIFRQSDRDKGSIQRKIKDSREKFTGNEMINLLWMLLPGFIVSNIWKDKNNQNFKTRPNPSQF